MATTFINLAGVLAIYVLYKMIKNRYKKYNDE